PLADLLGAVGAQDEQPAGERRPPEEEAEEAQGELVGPLQVVEDEEQRLLLAEGQERLPQILVEPLPRRRGEEVGGVWPRLAEGAVPLLPRQVGQRGLVRGQHRATPPDDPLDLLGAQLAAAIGDRLERLAERPQGEGAPSLGAVPQEHPSLLLV